MGSWVHIATSGGASGWVAGWYKISSVASNQATVDASIGAAVLSNYTANTAVGVASTATPTAATASVDYSQVPAAVFSLTGLTTAAANAIILTASATKAMVGNLFQITGGTNFMTGFYVVQACTAGVSLTVDRTCTTAAGLAGTAGIGGALASPGQAGALWVTQSAIFIKQGTYSITSASTNVAAGCMSMNEGSHSTTRSTFIWGYGTLRGDQGTKPVLQLSSVSAATIITTGSGGFIIDNIAFDGAANTTSRGINNSGNPGADYIKNCKFSNFTNNAVTSQNWSFIDRVEATGCSTQPALNIKGTLQNSYIHDNTVTGVSALANSVVSFTISVNNTGATSDGFLAASYVHLINCTTYANGRDGFRVAPASTGPNCIFQNCLAVSDVGWGFNSTTASSTVVYLLNCAAYNTGSGTQTGFATPGITGFVTLTSNPFVNAAGGNFALTPAAIALLAGIPGSFPGLSGTTGYLYMGAVQPNNQGIVVSTNTAIITNPLSVVGY